MSLPIVKIVSYFVRVKEGEPTSPKPPRASKLEEALKQTELFNTVHDCHETSFKDEEESVTYYGAMCRVTPKFSGTMTTPEMIREAFGFSGLSASSECFKKKGLSACYDEHIQKTVILRDADKVFCLSSEEAVVDKKGDSHIVSEIKCSEKTEPAKGR